MVSQAIIYVKIYKREKKGTLIKRKVERFR